MALAHTGGAIGAVTRALVSRLASRTGNNVVVGRPDQSANDGRHLSLFLYETLFDPFLKNHPLDEGQKPPLWLVLKYLLTAFDATGESDSENAYDDLGAGMRALQEADLLRLDGLPATIVQALDSNPEELHVTFDEAPAELLSKLMQGDEEGYRLSVAFQVRPVLIAPADPPSYTLLVGIDYTQAPPALVTDPAHLDVIPSLGSFITEIEPTGFEVGETVTLKGTDLHLANLSVRLGPVELPVTMQQPDRLQFVVSPALVNGDTISAGSHPVTVIQTLSSGRRRSGNMLIGNLVPTVTAVNLVLPVSSPPSPPNPPNLAFATIDLTGVLLGNDNDDVLFALFRDGRTVRMFDVLTTPPGPPPPSQTQKRLTMTSADAVPEGEYLTILKVNGQQAINSFRVNLVP